MLCSLFLSLLSNLSFILCSENVCDIDCDSDSSSSGCLKPCEYYERETFPSQPKPIQPHKKQKNKEEKNVIIICGEDESSSEENCRIDIFAISNCIKGLQNRYLCELEEEVRFELAELRDGVKSILKSSNDKFISSTFNCLNNLERGIFCAVDDLFCKLLHSIDGSIFHVFVNLFENETNLIRGKNKKVGDYIVTLQLIDNAEQLKTLVKNNINGPLPTITGFINEIETGSIPIINVASSELSNTIHNLISNAKEELIAKIKCLFDVNDVCVKNALSQIERDLETAVSSLISKHLKTILFVIQRQITLAEEEIISHLKRILVSSGCKLNLFESRRNFKGGASGFVGNQGSLPYKNCYFK